MAAKSGQKKWTRSQTKDQVRQIQEAIEKHKHERKGEHFTALTPEEIEKKLKRVRSPMIVAQEWNDAAVGGTVSYRVVLFNPDPTDAYFLLAARLRRLRQRRSDGRHVSAQRRSAISPPDAARIRGIDHGRRRLGDPCFRVDGAVLSRENELPRKQLPDAAQLARCGALPRPRCVRFRRLVGGALNLVTLGGA